MTSAVMGSVGASVGSLAGGTFGWTAATWSQIGWTAGVLAANYLFAPDGPEIVNEGPRLTDLKVTSSAYGIDIPKVYGSYRISGNIIWALPLKETRHEETQESGKGGGGSSETTIWYTYTGTWAMALCEGPISGIKKIWFSGKLVYDNGIHSTPLTASNHADYLGTGTQSINWSIQSNKPDTPAYRNTAYIVFSNIELETLGNVIPNVTVEVVASGTPSFKVYSDETNMDLTSTYDVLYPVCTPKVPAELSDRVSEKHLLNFDGNYSYFATWSRTNTYLLKNKFVSYYMKELTGYPILRSIQNMYFEDLASCITGPLAKSFPIGVTKCKQGYLIAGASPGWSAFMHYCEDYNSFVSSRVINTLNPTGDVGAWGGVTIIPYGLSTFYNGIFYVCNTLGGSVVKGAGLRNLPTIDEDLFPDNNKWGTGSYYYHGAQYEGQLSAIIPSALYNNATISKVIINFDVNYDRIYILSTTEHKDHLDLDCYGLNGNFLFSKNIRPTLLSTINGYIPTYYNTYFFVDDNAIHILFPSLYTYEDMPYVRLTLDGELIAIKYADTNDQYLYQFGVEYTNAFYSNGLIKVFVGTAGIHHDITINVGYIYGSILLKTITDDLCRRSGLLDYEYDNSNAGETLVGGYVLTKNISSRAALEPILSAYDYSLIESGHKLILRSMSQPVALTINYINLIDKNGNIIEESITQSSDLMKSFTIRYSNPLSDYQIGIQSSMRVDTTSTNETTKELAITLTDDEAKKITEKTLYKNWITRYSYKFLLPFISPYNSLITGDVIKLELKYNSIEVKIMNITITENKEIEIVAINNESSSYISNAIGSDTGNNFAEITSPAGITAFEILDVPTLSNSYIDFEGVYVVASGYSSSWKGCNIYSKSLSQDDFSKDFTILGKTAIGAAIDALPDHSTHVWDRTSEITVTSSKEISGVSESLLLSGSNYALIGEEIVQYATVIDNSNGTYTLSDFLRGRRGTENKTSSHTNNEIFVLLDANNTGFISKTINSNDLYSAITLGESTFEPEKQLQYLGKNLMPFSVSYLRGKRETNNDVNIQWMRRSRYISGSFKTLPVVDTPETYDIDVYENSTYITTYTVSTSSFTYDSTKATNDGVTITNTLKFIVYHVSQVYGQGTSNEIIIN